MCIIIKDRGHWF